MLTGNDVALAQMAVWLAVAYWKKQPPSDYGKEEIRKLQALGAKMDDILERAYPTEASEMSGGDESVLMFDPAMTEFNQLRAAGVL